MVQRFALTERLRRLAHYRLVIPLKRSPHPPEHAARGVGVGLFWAFTPLMGIQLPLVLLTWLLARRSQRFNFSLLIAAAWTWVTNIFTIWPVYYVFYVTGRVVLGDWAGSFGYNHVVDRFRDAVSSSDGLFQSVIAGLSVLAHDQALPLIVGSIPYSLFLGWFGYTWSLAYIRHRRQSRALRAIARRRQQANPDAAERLR